MRLIYLSLLVIVFCLPRARAEQDSGSKLAVPSLGWVFDPRVMGVRPLMGTLGASTLGRPLDAGFPMANATISAHGFLLAVSAEDYRVRLVDLRGGTPVVRILDGVEASPDRIVLSPSGTVAMLYYAKAARLQVIVGLPDTAVMGRTHSLSSLSGAATELAISDDGERSLLVLSDGALWMLDEKSGSYPVPVPGANPVIAFRPGGHDALAAVRSGELYLVGSGASVSNYGSVAAEGLGDAVGAQLSRDGSHAYVAYSNGSIAEVDSTSASVRTVSCACRATGLHAVNSLVFRLNDPSASPLLLVHVADTGPRVWFVPPDRAELIERSEQ